MPDHPWPPLHLPSLFRLLGILARYRPQTVNIHYITSVALYFVLLKKLFGYRLVLSAHGSDIRLPRPISARLLPRILGGADAITVVSEELRQRVLELSGIEESRVMLVPNGVDHEFWTPAPRAGKGAELIAAGRLEKVKGVDILLEAFARIVLHTPQARLVITGEGTERDALERQAERLGLGDLVEFTGFLQPEALRARFRAADLFVLPSRSEGFPLALLEAMATGLPFVAADVGGVGEIATPETGMCVPAEDPEALAEALHRMLMAKTGGEAARRRAEDFSRSRAEATYLRILDGPAAGPADAAAAAVEPAGR